MMETNGNPRRSLRRLPSPCVLLVCNIFANHPASAYYAHSNTMSAPRTLISSPTSSARKLPTYRACSPTSYWRQPELQELHWVLRIHRHAPNTHHCHTVWGLGCVIFASLGTMKHDSVTPQRGYKTFLFVLKSSLFCYVLLSKYLR